MAGETYALRYPGGFVDGSGGGTPVDSAFLNAVETALLYLLGEDPAANEVPVWSSGSARFVFQKITNDSVSATAAIDKTKLGALAIADADVSGAAAIAQSKLALDIVNANVNAAAAIARTKLASPATCLGRLNANQALTNGGAVNKVSLTEDFDNDTMHDDGVNPSRITFTTAGRYLINGNAIFAQDTTGTYRQARLLLNNTGTMTQVTSGPVTGTVTGINVSILRTFAAADYIELVMEHDATTNINALGGATTGQASRLSAIYMSS